MPKRSLRLAYLTTEYPKASHTFIRREILELERRGHHVMRLSIRSASATIVDSADQAEARRTLCCLSEPPQRLVAAALREGFRGPARFSRALGSTAVMSRRSERGLVRHLAYLAEASYLLELLRSNEIEHVHVHFGTNAAAVARLIRTLGGPTYSFTVHGPDEFDAPIGLALGDKVHDAAFVIAISDFCSAQIRRWAALEDWDRIHVVRCTVSDPFFEQATPIPKHSNGLVCVGRLSAQKAQPLLLEAMSRLVAEGVEAKLVLAGDGELRPVIERRIAELGLSEHVRITGWVDEAAVRRLIADARALVLPSFAEGLPVVIMEAMALRRPVVSTLIAGIPELVRPGETGWLIPAGNVEALVVALREVLSSPTETLDEMGLRGQERVGERHRVVAEVDKLESLFLGRSSSTN